MATAPAAAEEAEAVPLQRPAGLRALEAAGARAGPRAAGRGSKWQPLPAASIRGCTAPGHCGKLRASTPPPQPIRGHLSPPPLGLARPAGSLQFSHPFSFFLNPEQKPGLNLNSACRQWTAVEERGEGWEPRGLGRWGRTLAVRKGECPGKLGGKPGCRALVSAQGKRTRTQELLCPASGW